MSETALFLNVLLALLKRAARGERLEAGDAAIPSTLPGRPEGDAIDEALRFLGEYTADQDALQADEARLAAMMGRARAHADRIEDLYQEVM